MYVFGGCYTRDGSIIKYFNDLFWIKFSMTKKSEWKKISPKGVKPEPRHSHSSSMNGSNYMVIYAGQGIKRKCLNDMFMYNLKQNSWYIFELSLIMLGFKCNFMAIFRPRDMLTAILCIKENFYLLEDVRNADLVYPISSIYHLFN